MSEHEQMDEMTDRCWAFSPEMERCEMVAGHDDKHAIVRTWNDDECWTPIRPPAPTSAAALLSSIPVNDPDTVHFTDAPPDYSNSRCFCGHKWHGTERCDAPDGDDFTCDCSNSIAI